MRLFHFYLLQHAVGFLRAGNIVLFICSLLYLHPSQQTAGAQDMFTECIKVSG